jgi:cytochrome bd-type quinol oxidase subunit 1
MNAPPAAPPMREIEMQNGRLVVTDWLKVIVNPSWLFRLPHMLTAAYLTASFLVARVGAFYLLRKKHTLTGILSATNSRSVTPMKTAAPMDSCTPTSGHTRKPWG